MDTADAGAAPQLVPEADGRVWTAVSSGQNVELRGYDGQLLARWSGFIRPSAPAFGAGSLLVADPGLGRVVRLPLTGLLNGLPATPPVDAPAAVESGSVEQVSGPSVDLAWLLSEYRFHTYRLPEDQRPPVLAPLLYKIQNASPEAWAGLDPVLRLAMRKLPDPALQFVLGQHPLPAALLADDGGRMKLGYLGMMPDPCAGEHRRPGLYFQLPFEIWNPSTRSTRFGFTSATSKLVTST